MQKQNRLGQWLKDRCEVEHLSLRKANEKTGLSHATISDITKGVSPTGETIRKLAAAFSQGENERLALEDYLLTLAGYRSEREGEKTKQVLGELMDKVSEFTDPEVKVMISFARFIKEVRS